MSIELLAPAGTYESLTAAINGGADAIYLGGSMLNARMRAKNFDNNELEKAVKLCHSRGVRVYVTLNTIVFDKECDDVIRYVGFLYSIGVDALIVADIGLAQLIHQLFPLFPLHASTQMSGHNSAAADFLADCGFTRMVFARELSKENIQSLCEKSKIELEMFVHGAYCVSYSGQCLCSWAMGGRSGNRGECAQPCRKKYNGKYPLSLKDNCMAEHITEIINMGVSSLKIEGRLKSPDYVYSVTSQYRKLLDENRNADGKEIKHLEKVFSRNGFTDGYYMSRIGQDMIGVRDENQKFTASIVKQNYCKEPIVSRVDQIELEKDKYSFPKATSERDRVKSARFLSANQISEKINEYFDIIYLPVSEYQKKYSNVTGVILPEVITDSEENDIRNILKAAYENGARHALVGNIGHIKLAKEIGYEIHGDYRLNIANNGSAKFYQDRMTDFILSPELSLAQIKDIIGKKSVIVYGRIPLMVLEKRVEYNNLVDDKGVSFPIIHNGKRDVLINSSPIWMADKEKELKSSFAFNRHFIFTIESKKEIEDIIQGYIENKELKSNYKRIK